MFVGVLVTAGIIVICSSVETVWEPMRKTGGEGTQAVGESDLVLPGGGVEVAMAQESTVYSTEEVNGMSDAEKLALIEKMLADATGTFLITQDAGVWQGVVMCINSVLEFGGVPVG